MTQHSFKSTTLRWAARPQRVSIHAVLTLAIIGFALGMRLYRLGVQSLWLDEGGTWAVVTQNNWPALFADLFSPNAAYPLYHLLLKAWIGLVGDSEWALRLPSALAGVATVGVLMLAASEVFTVRDAGSSSVVRRPSSVVAGLFAASSPYALWHAQDAKVYSLLMLMVALLLWAGLRFCTVHLGKKQFSWHSLLPLGGLALFSLFVHRLALLPVAGMLFALAIAIRQTGWKPGATEATKSRTAFRTFVTTVTALAILTATLGVFGLSRAVSSNGWQESGHSAASPLQSLWLNLQHFILDRGDIGGYLGVPSLVWGTPALALTLWGLALLLHAAWRGDAPATLVLAMFAVPLLLFAIALAFTPIYESRYAAVAFPAWVLVVVWPFAGDREARRPGGTETGRHGNRETRRQAAIANHHVSLPAWLHVSRLLRWLLFIGSLLISITVLIQPQHGMFSGAPVKEQWREGVAAIAAEAHSDDLIVLHPYYTLPLWQYYAPRVTANALPQPAVFNVFGEGLCVENNAGNAENIRECYRRTYDEPFRRFADGKKRALLLIAPDHAATIDPPKTIADLQRELSAGQNPPTKPDPYGWVGLRFLYPQRFWACGTQEFLGIKTMCLSFPETFRAAVSAPSPPPAPAISLEATFGGEIMLRGYRLDLFAGEARPGGTLPITLYWQSLVNPSKNYSMFLHLCQRCDQPPLAGVDDAPLHGYPPAGRTSTWQGYPVHDERSLELPANLTPGRYTLILGVRPRDEDPADQTLRLPVTSTQGQIIGGTRLVLGEVEIMAK